MRIEIHLQDIKIKIRGIDIITDKIKNGLLIEKKRLLNEENKKKNKPKPKRKFTKKEQEFIDELKQALIEVKLHQEGKIKLKSAREFLEELRAES